jgi:hypothetical protein
MTENQIKVRRKEIVKPKYGKFLFLVSLGVVAVLGLITLFFASQRFNLFDSANEIAEENGVKVYRVSSTSGLQDAISKAESGDVIELEAGKTYSQISLPDKKIKDFITIRSSAYKQLPENVRVKPSQTNLMPKIVAVKASSSAISTEKNSHHFKFIGIEVTTATKDYTYNLIYLGDPDQKSTVNPHDFEFDRCYIHSKSDSKTRRGFAANGVNITIKNSYIEGFAYPLEETQGICAWVGTKNLKIINNYIEGGAENIMIGGSDPASVELTPTDIEIRGNYIFKPESWKGVNAIKCLFELKNAKKVQFIGNYLESNPEGYAFRMTIRNQDGSAPFSTIEDVLIQDNVIKNSDGGINILGRDDTNPSAMMKRLKVTNNLWLDLKSVPFSQVAEGENIEISNNTVFNKGSIINVHRGPTKNLKFVNNIVASNDYGYGFEGFVKTHQEFRAYISPMMKNNLIINNKKDPYFYMPDGNYSVTSYDEVGFVNAIQNNFALPPNSKYKGIGCNTDTIAKDSVKK